MAPNAQYSATFAPLERGKLLYTSGFLKTARAQKGRSFGIKNRVLKMCAKRLKTSKLVRSKRRW